MGNGGKGSTGEQDGLDNKALISECEIPLVVQRRRLGFAPTPTTAANAVFSPAVKASAPMVQIY